MKFLQKFSEKINSIFKKTDKPKAAAKGYHGSGVSVKFSAQTEKQRLENEEKLNAIIKKYINSPEELIESMKSEGLEIYRVKNAGKLLKKIRCEEGFVLPQKGKKAVFLNFITSNTINKKFDFKFSTPPVFIFDANNVEIYTIAYALHKYYAYKTNMPGFDPKSQKLFEKAQNKNNGSVIAKMKISDVDMCREAMSRDMEAIHYAIKISREHAGAKNALNKIKSNNKTIL